MLLHYFRVALAHLRISQQTTVINVVGLALGFTCFIVAYVIAGYLAGADRQFANVDRIYTMQQRNVKPGDDTAKPFATSASPSLATYLRAEFPELEAVARRTDATMRVDADDQVFDEDIIFADPELLRVFDFRFLDGDPVTALDEPGSAVLTEEKAQLLFGTVNAVGRTFTISRQIGHPVNIVVRGIVEQGDVLTTARFPSERFGLLVNIAAWPALAISGAGAQAIDRDDWSNPDLAAATYVLLPADGSLRPAEFDRRLRALGERIVPPGGDDVTFRARHVSRYFDDMVTSMLGFLGIVADVPASQLFFLPGLIILGMACFNYVNLTVAVASTRAKEVGLCKVLGAGVRQIIQQHLLEGLVAVLIGYALALVLAALIIGAVNNAFAFTIQFLAAMGPSFWLTSALIVLVTTAAASGYPSWVMSRFRPLESLRAGSKRSGPGALRGAFIGIQFTVASVLLTVVLVMYAQNGALRGHIERLPADPYVQIDNNLLETPDVDPEVLTTALLAAPQIKAVTGMADTVWSGSLDSNLFSRSRFETNVPVSLRTRLISYDFFSTLGIEMLGGRSFIRGRDIAVRPGAEGDGRRQTSALGIVLDRDAALALGWLNPAEAIGQTLYQRSETSAALATAGTLAFEVIGIVDKAPLQVISLGVPNVYRLDPYNSRLILRLAPDDVPAALAHIESVWEQLVPESRLRRVRFLDEALERAMSQMNVMTTALLGIAAFGFLVALAGIFGMALFVASRRRHEIGIRKTLGADANTILRQLLAELGKPVLIGNVIAWPIAYSLAQIYSNLYLEQAPLTPWPYVLSLAVTLGLAWLGVGGQALRAARLRPARVLRCE